MKKIIIAGLLLLTGCSSSHHYGLWHDKSEDYLEAKSYPPLYVPTPLTKESAGTLYEIPPSVASETQVTSVPDIRPPDLRT
ncbi:MAG: hypothetical protein CMF48_01630 [Legionellales bacterium]|nr:hypothetical protein [Legionellales bacterium]